MHKALVEQKASMNISSYDLFIVHRGIECAMFPYLYPTTDFTDTGILEHYQSQSGDKTNRVCSIGLSWTRKVLSSVRVYGEQKDLPFFLYEKHMAHKYFFAHVRAKSMGVTGDVMARDSQTSSGYWDAVQDSLADLVRIMKVRCYDQENYPELYRECRNLRGEVWLCAFPNVFLTIAPAEWKFPRPAFAEPYRNCVFACAYIMALHMYQLVRTVWMFLSNARGHKYFMVFEWCMKTEYQGRGTPHWHIAAWVVSFGLLEWLKGRTGTAVVSTFVKFIQLLFSCEVDVQIGNGRLNYINGYVSKDHDAVDVGLGEYVQKDSTSSWLAAYRLLCKSSPCLPEVAIRMAQFSEFERSYTNVLLYPPQPAAMVSFEGRQGNFSSKMYGFYLQAMRDTLAAGQPVSESFLLWHRGKEYDKENGGIHVRAPRHQQHSMPTSVVACRYWFELTDGFWGQFAITQVPHLYASDLLPRRYQHLDCMQNFVGLIEYLMTWEWGAPLPGDEAVATVYARVPHEDNSTLHFRLDALPFLIDFQGEKMQVGTGAVAGQAVFSADTEAFNYLVAIVRRDLQYRGMRDDRIESFRMKQRANFLLYQLVRKCDNAHQYENLRQQWDTVNRPQYQEKDWSAEQKEALQCVYDGCSHEDEKAKAESCRWLFVFGPPGSGKSAVLLEMAIWGCSFMTVLLVCPTGYSASRH